MFQLDDQFLADIGLSYLPEEQQETLLEYVYSEFEKQVGEQLANSLSDGQLSEFEMFASGDDEKIQQWVRSENLNYESDLEFQQIKQDSSDDMDEATILAEYAAIKWLEKNCPDYNDTVARVLEKLKQEVSDNREKILSR